jgi:AcrR family transcriptional regulator
MSNYSSRAATRAPRCRTNADRVLTVLDVAGQAPREVATSSKKHAVPRVRDRVRQVTREALLDAAEELFSDAGIDGARVEDIAARAGVAVGTMYNYFGDSRRLLDELTRQRGQDLIKRLDETMALLAAECWDTSLDAFVRTIVEHVEEHWRFYAILLQCESRKIIFPATNDVSKMVYQRAQALGARGLRLGALSKSRAELFPALLLSLVRAPRLYRTYGRGDSKHGPPPEVRIDFAGEIIQLLAFYAGNPR